ncbi:MAG: phosphate ABC transporter ATP-binding protein [Nitrospinaceae bacterium]|nr:phosphate ABC transporter ATP-binding protein [Nitrospinaceae bacterium]NIS87237.1 phosphate ABC transporter ATP-binding protein [Nitrospinaceae bacterium]
MTPKDPVLELQNATVRYNGRPVLEGLTRVFSRNAVTAVIGPSGSGKTTLLRTLSRLNDRVPGFRVEGGLRVLGREIYRDSIDVYGLRQRVGMIFQSPCVFPRSIYENVLFGLKHLGTVPKAEQPEIVERLLRRVSLWAEVCDRLHKPAPTLSQGQQQRLAIARTLAVEPEVLLMDEPTSALDPKSVQAIEALIDSLRPTHTVVLVTHNLDQARRIGDDIVFLYQGRIWESGPNPEFFERPARPETRDYLSLQLRPSGG